MFGKRATSTEILNWIKSPAIMKNEHVKKEIEEEYDIDLDEEESLFNKSFLWSKEDSDGSLLSCDSIGDVVFRMGAVSGLWSLAKHHGSVTATVKSIATAAKVITFWTVHILGITLIIIGVGGLIYLGVKELVSKKKDKEITSKI